MGFPARLLNSPRRLAFWFLVVGLLLAAWVYAPALGSKLYLDSTKLYQLERVYEEQGRAVNPGDIGFGSEKGRIVSQVSFYLNIMSADGLDTRAVKLTNVVIHLVNAALVYVLAILVLAKSSFAERRFLLAGLIALAWLLSAVNVGSVIYAIQRMNQLSTLFTLLALIVYMYTRDSVLAGAASAARLVLAIIGILLLAVLAYGSKENGVLLFAFIAMVEFYLYPTIPRFLEKRSRLIVFSLVVLVMIGVFTAWIADSYWVESTTRNFTMGERLLTQCRILWVYIGQLILPSSLATGLYQDGYPISRGLFSPATTVFGLAGLLGLVAFSLYNRNDEKWQLVAFGIAFFLAGHILESTILPLELYYEHRNYLPSVGLYMALILAGYLLLSRIRLAAAVVAAVAYFALFVLVAHAKALTWTDELAAYDAALQRSYLSPRAASERAQLFLEEGEIQSALLLLERVASEFPDQALRTRLQVLFVHCLAGFPPDDRLYAELTATTGRELAIEVSQALQNVLGAFEQTRCPAIMPERISAALATISGDIRSAGRSAWHVDYYIASFYLLDDPRRAVSFLETRLMAGEQSAGWMLRELLRENPDLEIRPETRQALAELPEE